MFPLKKHCGNGHLYVKPKITLQKSQDWEITLKTGNLYVQMLESSAKRKITSPFCTAKVKGEVSLFQPLPYWCKTKWIKKKFPLGIQINFKIKCYCKLFHDLHIPVLCYLKRPQGEIYMTFWIDDENLQGKGWNNPSDILHLLCLLEPRCKRQKHRNWD